jgi:serine-type D-Ala-D-Ala carboxypeptidase/endopeptidase (penicillin-binding protein 4)
MVKFGLVVASVAAAALGSVAASQAPPAGAPAAAAPPGVEAPRATPRVGPEVVALESDLRQIIRSAGLPQSSTAVLVVSLDQGDTIFSFNPDLALAPASNMKLFSTAAALYYLGPNFRYSTFALADGEIRDGAVHGDVVLYGTGDPAISSRMLGGALPPLRALADSLVALGVREIRGDVVGDGSYFDDAWLGDGWREEYRLASYSAPVGALSLAENIISIRALPGGAVGAPAEIRTVPSTAGLLVHNNVRTVASGTASLRIRYDPSGLVLDGQIPRGSGGIARSVAVVDPVNFAAAAFRSVLEAAGIQVHGGVRTVRESGSSPISMTRLIGTADGQGSPAPRVIGTHLSPPLSELVTVTNHVSQNLFAEALFKTVGRVALGEGTFAAGGRAVQFFLECERPFDAAGVQFVDGSGLSPLNRMTARTTIHLLDLMTRTDVWEPFLASLPEAASPQGGRHSLRGRMGGTAAARNLRAKTGTISNVSSLAGYVTAANGELLAFSIYTNDIPATWQAKRAEDAMGARLGRFTRPIATPPVAAGEQAPGEGAPGVEPAPEPDQPDAPPEDVASPAAPPPARPEQRPEPQPQSTPATRTHRVSSGDTMDAIARRYGTTVAEIQRLNPGVEPRRIRPGQELRIPG